MSESPIVHTVVVTTTHAQRADGSVVTDTTQHTYPGPVQVETVEMPHPVAQPEPAPEPEPEPERVAEAVHSLVTELQARAYRNDLPTADQITEALLARVGPIVAKGLAEFANERGISLTAADVEYALAAC